MFPYLSTIKIITAPWVPPQRPGSAHLFSWERRAHPAGNLQPSCQTVGTLGENHGEQLSEQWLGTRLVMFNLTMSPVLLIKSTFFWYLM